MAMVLVATSPAGAGADTTVTIPFGTGTRSFLVHVPAGYNPAIATPLMLVEAGKNATGKQTAHMTGFDSLADGNGFFAVYPNQNGPTWVLSGPNNDVAFNQAVVAWMEATYTIDPTRIYISGYADGGRMATTYACTQTAGGYVAGVAIVSNDINTMDEAVCNAQPQPPTSFLLFHGTADTESPYNGGMQRNGTDNLSAEASTQYWAGLDGCQTDTLDAPTPDELSNGAATTDQEEQWTGCQNGTTVSFYTINGGGHNWPGSVSTVQNPVPKTGPVSLDLPASAIIWQTLSAFTTGALFRR
jgi:polyhydroxybutyrate depolymerase